MKQTEVGRRYRVHVYYTKHLVRSQAISNQMFGFSVIHKGMNKQMAQNVKDVQIDRIRELAKEQGVSMRYLCELVGKKRNFLAMVALGKDYVDENELMIIASRLGTTVDYLTGKTDDSGVSIQQQIDAAITAKEADELTAIFEKLSEEDRQKALTILRALAEAKRD